MSDGETIKVDISEQMKEIVSKSPAYEGDFFLLERKFTNEYEVLKSDAASVPLVGGIIYSSKTYHFGEAMRAFNEGRTLLIPFEAWNHLLAAWDKSGSLPEDIEAEFHYLSLTHTTTRDQITNPSTYQWAVRVAPNTPKLVLEWIINSALKQTRTQYIFLAEMNETTNEPQTFIRRNNDGEQQWSALPVPFVSEAGMKNFVKNYGAIGSEYIFLKVVGTMPTTKYNRGTKDDQNG